MPVVILMQFENLVMSRQSQLTYMYVRKATKIVVIKLCDYRNKICFMCSVGSYYYVHVAFL